MEGFMDALGTATLIVLVLVGLIAGWLASLVAGGHRLRYMVLGVIGALVLPFLLAALGIGLLAAGGLLAIAVTALIGAVVVLVVARLIFD